jgi:hypothetical protein
MRGSRGFDDSLRQSDDSLRQTSHVDDRQRASMYEYVTTRPVGMKSSFFHMASNSTFA